MQGLINLLEKIFHSIATKSTAAQLLKLAFMVAGFLASSWVYYDQYIKPEYHNAMALYESYSIANNLLIDNPSSADCQPQQIKYSDNKK